MGVNVSLFSTVRANSVQSIRAFRSADLQAEAVRLGQHFLVANCAHASTKAAVLAAIAKGFYFPDYFGENFDALYDCLTGSLHKSGTQPGFVVVLEQIAMSQEFDKEARETLLDVFRDAADFWEKKHVPFRVFYSFA